MDSFEPNLISVVMPCYNAASFVEEAVGSVLGQTYHELELIVVDDGSTDNSVEILERLAQKHHPRMKLLFQDRMGPYPARNQGLQHASGGLVAFMDADDLWREDCLEKLHAALLENRADVAYCGWQNFGEGAPGTDPYIPPDYAAMDTAAEFLRSCPWPIHAALVRRPVLDAARGFSERRFSAMDYDLWLRIYAHTRKIARVPEVMAFYRWHDKGQISKTKWKQVMDAWQVRRDFVAHYPERVTHLAQRHIYDLTDGGLLKEAYRAYWKRDLDTAQPLFRRAFTRGIWRAADLKYMLPGWLPAPLFRWLVNTADRIKEGRAA